MSEDPKSTCDHLSMAMCLLMSISDLVLLVAYIFFGIYSVPIMCSMGVVQEVQVGVLNCGQVMCCGIELV